MDSSTDQQAAYQQLQQRVLAMPMARTFGLRFLRVAPGEVELEMPITEPFTFRPGQLQAAPVFALADFAAVSASGTLLAPGWANATIDATTKFLAPAQGAAIRARGRVVHGGKLLSVCAADVFAVADDGRETLCATWLGTARYLELRPATAT